MAKVGRPKGSTQAKKPVAHPTRSRGRPKGSGNKQASPNGDAVVKSKPRGRHKGSRNEANNDGEAASESRGKTENAVPAVKNRGDTKPSTPAESLTSIAGRYELSCKEIENTWSESDREDMYLDINDTKDTKDADDMDDSSDISEPMAGSFLPASIFAATFNLGVLSGAMLLSADKAALKAHIDAVALYEARMNNANYDGDLDSKPKEKVARKKKTVINPRKFFFCWQGHDNGNMKAIEGSHWGEITFKGANHDVFEGCTDIPYYTNDGTRLTGKRCR